MSSNIGRNLLHMVTVSHSKSSHKINIPIDIARATGIDKVGEVIVIKKGDNKIEVKRYEEEGDLKEYFSDNKAVVD